MRLIRHLIRLNGNLLFNKWKDFLTWNNLFTMFVVPVWCIKKGNGISGGKLALPNKKLVIILIFMVIAQLGLAQISISTGENPISIDRILGDYYLEKNLPDKAIEYYKKSQADNSQDPEKMLRIAEAYAFLGNKDQVYSWYQKAVEADPNLSPAVILKYVFAFNQNKMYDEVNKWIGIYNQKVAALDNLSNYKDSTIYLIENLSSINTPFEEMSPVIYNDELLYFSMRSSVSDSLPALFSVTSPDKNSKTKASLVYNQLHPFLHRGQFSVYARKKQIFFSAADVHGIERIYYCNIPSQPAEKVKAEQIQFSNFDGAAIHPSISADGTTLYFSSRQSGITSGYDLYRSEGKGNNWSTPKKLGANINSKGDELYPVIADDHLLFFASNGHNSFGQLDVFKVNLSDPFAKPENLGPHVNGAFDDFSFFPTSDGKNGYLVSNRPGGQGLNDIYRLTIRALKINSEAEEELAGNERGTITLFSSGGEQIKLKGKPNENIRFSVTPASNYHLFIRRFNVNGEVKSRSDNVEDSPTMNLKVGMEYNFLLKKFVESMVDWRDLGLSPLLRNLQANPGDLITFQFIPTGEANPELYENWKDTKISFRYETATVLNSDTLVLGYTVEQNNYPTSEASEELLAANDQEDELEQLNETSRQNVDNAQDDPDRLDEPLPGEILASRQIENNLEETSDTVSIPINHQGPSTDELLAKNISNNLPSSDSTSSEKPELAQEEKTETVIGEDLDNVDPSDHTPASGETIPLLASSIESDSIEDDSIPMASENMISQPENLANDTPNLNDSMALASIVEPNKQEESEVVDGNSGQEALESAKSFDGYHSITADADSIILANTSSSTSDAESDISEKNETNDLLNSENVILQNDSSSTLPSGEKALAMADVENALPDSESNDIKTEDETQPDKKAMVETEDDQTEDSSEDASAHNTQDEISNENQDLLTHDQPLARETIETVSDVNQATDSETADKSVDAEVENVLADSESNDIKTEDEIQPDKEETVEPGDDQPEDSSEDASAHNTQDEISNENQDLLTDDQPLARETIETVSDVNQATDSETADTSVDAMEAIENTNTNSNYLPDTNNSAAVAKANENSSEVEATVSNANTSAVNANQYRVQIAASRVPLRFPELGRIYSGDKTIKEFQKDGYYKYYIAEEPVLADATRIRNQSGVKGAFVTKINPVEFPGKTIDASESFLSNSSTLTLNESSSAPTGEIQRENMETPTLEAGSDESGIYQQEIAENEVNANLISAEETPVTIKTQTPQIEPSDELMVMEEDNMMQENEPKLSSDQPSKENQESVEAFESEAESRPINSSVFSYRVQIAAAKDRLDEQFLSKLYKGDRSVSHFTEDGYFKYYIADEPNYFVAKNIGRESGIKNAFVVAYKGDVKWDLKEALQSQYKEAMQRKGSDLQGQIRQMIIVNFDFDEFTLIPVEEEKLREQVIDPLLENDQLLAVVNGHTDTRGSDAYNFGLSEERALFVLREIIREGIQKNRVETHYFGETQLMEACTEHEDCDEAVHHANRRVEVILYVK